MTDTTTSSESDHVVAGATPGSDIDRPGPRKVGDEVIATYRSPAVPATSRGDVELAWRAEIHVADATYIAPHFSAFDLPEGAHLVVTEPSGVRTRRYTGIGKDVPDGAGFWGMHMPGETAIIELYSDVALPEGAVAIDRFAKGIVALGPIAPANEELGTEAICGTGSDPDDSEEAKCYQSSEPTVYDKSRAVARLLINGVSGCTGWLVGSEGHLMTNEHCITSQSAAANTDYEFMAEGATCATDCRSRGACPGTIVADTGTLIQDNAAYDFALILLPTNPTGTYGYLQMREGGALFGERIYIPQHPQRWGKRIALYNGSNVATVTSKTEAPCTGVGAGDLGYLADTQGGSSGSPVLSYADHGVVGLHHCRASVNNGAGYCPNRAVPIEEVIAQLDVAGNLPNDSTVESRRDWGWAWAQSATGTYTASPTYSRNSSGGFDGTGVAQTITNLSTGRYLVEFPNLGDIIGGNVQVSAYGIGNERCNVRSWNRSGTTLRVYVDCRTPAGALVNTQFVSSYVRNGVPSGAPDEAYLWANNATAASYTPSATYQWNSGGGLNTIQRTGIGAYAVTLPDQAPAPRGGTVQVTGYGDTGDYCKVGNWSPSGTSMRINVRCFDTSGAAVDSRFTLYYSSTRAAGGLSGGHAWANNATSASYNPSPNWEYTEIFSSGEVAAPTTATRTGTGLYSMTYPSLSPFGSTALVTAYGYSSEYCKIRYWGGSGSVSVSIGCFDASGASVDTQYVSGYANTQL
ncbi:MAG: serine protease [Proteobacteria bacterium]|nr:serine protease [Pseudomonadota bacterium]